jgi:uncharacterized SAM-binding protein YcdF (DUF218 family)
MLVFKRLLECLLLPPFAPLLLIIVGLCLLSRRPRLGKGLAWGGVLLSLFLMLPVTVDALLAPIEDIAGPIELESAKGAQAIVILGGGGRQHAVEYGKPTVNRLTLERVRYGAKLARETGLPVLVSGGVAGAGDYPEARMMADSLTEDFGITPKWIEDGSENTEQNARKTAAILEKSGIRHIILVTHATHMRRALGYFSAAGFEVTPAPTAFFGHFIDAENSLSWLPSANTSYAGWYAMHEWIGLTQQAFTK